jgi:hypothetical protein
MAKIGTREFRRIVAATLFATAMSPAAPALAAGARDFDFEIGEWRVRHRRLRPTGEWLEFEGICRNRVLIDGTANLEEHDLRPPTGPYQAVGLRAFDAKTGEWSIWWLDGRYPRGPLGPPVRGRFENGVGAFYADYTQDGKPMRGRFLWSDITERSARWEQASSADGGKTWDVNWIMQFERMGSGSIPSAESRPGVRDFDFLHGDWSVRHRYLRRKGETREWLEGQGTVAHRPLMGGSSNVEEHAITAPSGSYRAVALRSYDAKASEWLIWWLDGRAPGALDPPVQGRFEGGVGTFYGETTIDGKPTRVRFVWSAITADSARWEQAYSSDSGQTWETNWIMEFRRS